MQFSIVESYFYCMRKHPFEYYTSTSVYSLYSYARIVCTRTVGIHYSAAKHFDLYSEELEMGPLFVAETISSEKSLFPRAAHFGFKLAAFGKRYPVFDVAIRQQGVASILKHFLHSKKLLTKQNIQLEDLLLPEKLLAKDRSIDRDPSEPSFEAESFSSYVVMKAFGADILFSMLDGKGLKDLLPTLPAPIADVAAKLLQGVEFRAEKTYALTASHVIPTIAGFPMYLNASGIAFIKMHGAVKAKLPTARSKSLEASITIRPNIGASAVVSVGVDIANVLKTRTALAAAAVSGDCDENREPFSARIKYDATHGSVIVEKSLPSSRINLFNATVAPVQVISVSPSFVSNRGFHFLHISDANNNKTVSDKKKLLKVKVKIDCESPYISLLIDF